MDRESDRMFAEDCLSMLAFNSNHQEYARCDRCDGSHRTGTCPYYSGPRGDHQDFWSSYGCQPVVVSDCIQPEVDDGVINGAVSVQPGDGSCLYNALCRGLSGDTPVAGSPLRLRQELADFLRANAHLEIAGNALAVWVKHDTGKEVED